MSGQKRTKKYVPKPVRSPVMQELHDQIAMGLHTAYRNLVSAPDENAFSMLARIFNMVGLSIEGDPRFADALILINSGASAMNQIGAKTGPLRAMPFELLPVRNAVNAIDQLLPRLDVVRLHQANMKLLSMQ